jgi:anti-anti-sigma factor
VGSTSDGWASFSLGTGARCSGNARGGEVRRRLPRTGGFSKSESAGGTLIAVLHLSSERAARDWATCEVEPHRDAAHVLPIGELDLATVPMVEARLSELYEAGFRHLVLDLRRVTFLDVAGLRLVLTWAAKAAAGGAAFDVIAGPPPVQRIFALTGTIDQVSFLETGHGYAAPRVA